MMISKKKLLFITGTRADYGKLKPLMKAVEENEFLELYIFVSGMHLLSIFGSTYDEVIKGGYKNIYVAFGLTHTYNMSVNLGNTVTYLSGYVENIKPDMIIVHGDRIDALAGAIVGALNNIRVAHIEGGELSGTIDESIRHAISKFAHVHFVSNLDAKKRLVQLGERADCVHVIGSPDIDIMLSENLPSIETVKEYYGIKFKNFGIFIYHPVTTEYESIDKKIENVIEALIRSNKNYIVIYPNNDLGSEIILNKFKSFYGDDRFVVFPSLRFEYFLTLLRNADVMIGNSSAGVRETSIYGIPAIDIGTRQAGRYDVSLVKNIQHVKEDVEQIMKAISQIEKFRKNQMYFGTGNSTQKFMDIILSKEIWEMELQKSFVDLKGVL
jgi:UDP-N-acetylglucosamine 2-epimerase (hydrolysing)